MILFYSIFIDEAYKYWRVFEHYFLLMATLGEKNEIFALRLSSNKAVEKGIFVETFCS